MGGPGSGRRPLAPPPPSLSPAEREEWVASSAFRHRCRYRLAHGLPLLAHDLRTTSAESKRAARKRCRDKPSRKEYACKKVKAWRAANPERTRELRANDGRKRDAKMRGRKATLTTPEWRATLEYFGGRCAYCLAPLERPSQDHVVAVARGGEHTQENVVPACVRCNSRKRDHPVWAALGF